MIATLGSILLGIAVIFGLIGEGELGCSGVIMIIVLTFALILVLGAGFLLLIGGGM